MGRSSSVHDSRHLLTVCVRSATLSELKLPRFMGTHRNARCVLCGFRDASERGYAAVVYLRVENSHGAPSVYFLDSKTKLAPIKGSTSTVPRLELCAAVLLAKWLRRVRVTLGPRLDVVKTFAWSDSTIVLSWLTTPLQSFKVFVSNRINQIQTLLPGCEWHHIPSENNPADCASRGMLPSELRNHVLYWNGPLYLYEPVNRRCTETLPVPV